jgi:hypothetical protein
MTALLVGTAVLFGMILLRVNASAEPSTERILRIYGEGRYEIYAVADLMDVLFGVIRISREPSPEELTRYVRPERRVAVLNTREGTAEWNLSRERMEDGVYLVLGGETPIYVCVPSGDGERWEYTVDIRPPETEQPEVRAGVLPVKQQDLSGSTEAENTAVSAQDGHPEHRAVAWIGAVLAIRIWAMLAFRRGI